MGCDCDPEIAFEQINASKHRTSHYCNDDPCPALAIMKDCKQQKWDRRCYDAATSEGLETLYGIAPIEELLDESGSAYGEHQDPQGEQFVL